MIDDLHFTPYDPAWPTRYSSLRQDLQQVLPNEATVEHIGSTAVPGLSAKDCIDLLIVIPPTHLSATEAALERLGYEARPGSFADDPARWFWRLIINDQRFAHAHVMLEGHPAAQEQLAVRDLLRRDPTWRDYYQQLKASLAASDDHDRPAYLAGKSNFVRQMTAAAMARGSEGR